MLDMMNAKLLPTANAEKRWPCRDLAERAYARFHDSYAAARDRQSLEFPILVVLAGSLAVVRRGERTETPLATELFDILKAVAHVPLSLFAVTHGSGDALLDNIVTSALLRIDGDTRALLSFSESSRWVATRTRSSSIGVLESSRSFAGYHLDAQRGDARLLDA